MTPFTLDALAVSMHVAGSPFSAQVIERMQTAGILRGEMSLNPHYLDYTQPGVVQQASRQLRDGGIEIWSCHIPFGAEWDISQRDDAGRRHAVELVTGTFAAAHELGARMAVLHPSWEPIDDSERDSRLQQAQVSLQELAQAVASWQLQLAVELLPRTCLGHTADEVMALIGPLDPSIVGVCLDANHANLHEDLSHAVRVLGDRLITLHISDNDGLDEKHWMPGQGVIAWPFFINTLKACRYRGAWVYEIGWPGDDKLEALRAVRANFQALLAQASQ